jgi:hypothetical protein
MPAPKSKANAATEEPWVPTRAEYLKDNPYASRTKDEARGRLRDLYLCLHETQREIDLLERVVASHNIAYYDKDGVPRLAE